MNNKVKVFFLLLGTFQLFNSCSKQTDEIAPQATQSFTFFDFRVAQNPSLAQDITCEIKGDTIFASTFSGTNLSALKPAFTDGIEVNVAGKNQKSGESSQNFNSIITYFIKANDGILKKYFVKFTDTNIPAVYISTNNKAIQSKTTYIPASMKINGNIAGDLLFGGEIEIRGRGNSTWDFPKKPYKIKLNKKSGLLGMNESKQWVLLANYADKSLIRNEVGFEISRRVGLAFTPASRFVEVILNGSYLGNYQLVEQIDVGKTKVDITEQNATTADISGGYLVESDGFANREPINFFTPRNMGVSVHHPESDEITLAQRNYIKNHFIAFENSLALNDSTNNYKKYFDIDSYINYYLVNEIMGNSDVFWSTYMYKNKNNDVIYTGPVWDFDISANNDQRIGNSVNKLMLDAAHNPKQWINLLMKDKVFRNKVRKRWNEINTNKLPLSSFIDALASKLEVSQKKNFIKWNILNEKVYLNFQVSGTFGGEVNYLKNYLSNRISWLNTQFNSSRFD